MKKLVFALLAVVILAACSDNDEPGKEITLTGGTMTSQTMYADETSKADGIKFNATAPWTATVSELTVKNSGSQVGWLALSAYSGGAGDHSLMLTLQPNTTGADRKAEIRIVSGETTIVVTLTQRAVNQGGEEPDAMRYVSKIIKEPGEYQSVVMFEYDAQNRIKTIRSQDSFETFTSSFVWAGNTITEREGARTTVYTLDANSYITSYLTTGTDYGDETGLFTYLNACLTKEKITFYSGSRQVVDEQQYVWNDGKIESSRSYYDGVEGSIQTFEYEKDKYDRKSNVKISYVLMMGHSLDCLTYTGKDTDYLPAKCTTTNDSTGKDNGVETYRYEKDSQGYVVKIYIKSGNDGEFLAFEIQYK